MDNQHEKIKGYRDLSQEEIDKMNEVKELGNKLGELISSLESIDSIDKSWLQIGKINLQTGVMQVVRSIAQPTTF